MSKNKKRELISQTYEMLKTTSPDDIKIRAIASACDCTSTVIYRHFEDLDHLIRFAAVRFLENYVIDIQKIVTGNSDPLELLLKMWQTFAKYAFENIEVFELFFWGRFKERLGDTILEYRQIFQEEWENLDGLFTSMFFNNDLKERNYIVLHRATVAGYFDHKTDRMLSDIACDLFHGLLLDYKECFREPGKAAEGAAYYMQMLESLVSKYRIK